MNFFVCRIFAITSPDAKAANLARSGHGKCSWSMFKSPDTIRVYVYKVVTQIDEKVCKDVCRLC